MIDQELASIAAWASANWMWDSSCGIYVHAGRAYVTGAAMAGTFNPPGSATLLAGIPSALCPAAPTPVRVWIDPDNSSSEYAPSSATHLGPKIPATMSPAGALTLDAGNPVVDTANTSLRLILDADWPVQPVADTYTSQDLSPVLSQGWDQVSGGYAAHGSRLHLTGQIRGNSAADGYFPLTGPPVAPAVMWDLANGGGGDRWIEVPIPQGYRAFVDHSGLIGALEIFHAPEQIAGNSGAGRLDNVFFERSPSGYVRRGQVLALAGPLAAGDAGLAWQGFSSYPVVDLSLASSWTGTIFSATLTVPRALLTQNMLGPSQVAMIVGLTPTDAYHKLVFGLDAGNNLIQRLYRVDGSGQTFITGGTVQAFGTDPVQIHASVQVTDQPPAGEPAGPAGTLYFAITVQGFGLQTGRDALGGSRLGQCALYVPAGASANELGVYATGVFPAFAPGDTLDFTGAGYPIAYQPPTATKVGIGPPGDVRAGLGAFTAGVSGGVRPRGWLRS